MVSSTNITKQNSDLALYILIKQRFSHTAQTQNRKKFGTQALVTQNTHMQCM